MLYRTVRSNKRALGFFSTLDVVGAKPLGACLEEVEGQ